MFRINVYNNGERGCKTFNSWMIKFYPVRLNYLSTKAKKGQIENFEKSRNYDLNSRNYEIKSRN